MPFDSLMLAAVRDELRRELLGGQVQRVVTTGPLTLGIEVYAHRRRRFLTCSAEPETARVCLADERPLRATDTPTPLLLLLRKYVHGGRLTGFDQPPYERLLQVRIAKRDEQDRLYEISLIIEAMGRRSNVILVGEDGTVLDALKRVGPTRNPRRPVLPHHAYQLPPTQDRLDPLEPASFERLSREAADGTARPLAELLGTRLAGFSPLAAREVAFRATADLGRPAAAADWSAVQAAVDELLAPLQTGEWAPCLVRDGDAIVAFAPYHPTHLAEYELEALASPSRAVELGLGQARSGRAVRPANRALVAEIDLEAASLQRKRAALERALATAEQAAQLRLDGEAILANLASIAPGQAQFEFDGRQIELDPTASGLENAEQRFREYRKARDAGRQVPELLEAAELRLRQLDDLRALAETAEDAARRALRDELRGTDAAPPRRPDRPGRRLGPRAELAGKVARHRTRDGLEVLVGQTARGNQLVTFKLADPDDLWLHARGVPGAHVILRTAGRPPTEASLLEAARLAARHSQAHAAARVEVDVTPRKHVRKIAAAPPGLVTYSHESTVAVELE